MAPKAKPRVTAKTVPGLKYFQQLQPLLARSTTSAPSAIAPAIVSCSSTTMLHSSCSSSSTQRSATCVSFNKPVASTRCRINSAVGAPLSSLSVAAREYDAEPSQAVVGELAQQTLPLTAGKDAEFLKGLTAVDGSLLPALPKMAWAL